MLCVNTVSNLLQVGYKCYRPPC